MAVVHISAGPGVFVLAAVHGKAVPNAADGAGVKLKILAVPIDCLKLYIPAVALCNLFGKVDIKAYIFAVFNIAVRRKAGIKAHNKFLLLCAAGKKTQRHYRKQYKHKQFLFHFNPPDFPPKR